MNEMTEEEYVEYLRVERWLYAWCLVTYGNEPPQKASNLAIEFYPYESPGEIGRGYRFHREAWHWAMMKIHGPDYSPDQKQWFETSREYRMMEESLRRR